MKIRNTHGGTTDINVVQFISNDGTRYAELVVHRHDGLPTERLRLDPLETAAVRNELEAFMADYSRVP